MWFEGSVEAIRSKYCPFGKTLQARVQSPLATARGTVTALESLPGPESPCRETRARPWYNYRSQGLSCWAGHDSKGADLIRESVAAGGTDFRLRFEKHGTEGSADNSLADGIKHDFRRVVQVEFLHEVGPVRLYGVEAEIEYCCRFFVGLTFGNQLKDLLFPFRQ